MIKITQEIDLNPRKVANSFAYANDMEQAEFLCALGEEVAKFDWGVQCSHIANEFDLLNEPANLDLTINAIETLLSHLKGLKDE